MLIFPNTNDNERVGFCDGIETYASCHKPQSPVSKCNDNYLIIAVLYQAERSCVFPQKKRGEKKTHLPVKISCFICRKYWYLKADIILHEKRPLN